MQIWQAIVLGIVQGLGEFLPISSSGHLVLLQQIMNVRFVSPTVETFFDVMLHLGTLVAVFAIFWKDIWGLFKKPFKTLLMLVVATIPAAITGLLFDDWIEEHLMGGGFLALFFAITACMLLACEYVAKHRKKRYDLSWRTTMPMGVMQAVALFPGISRSGSTIFAGIVSGGKTEDVAKFSFMMSIPVILGASVISTKHVLDDTSALALMGATDYIGIVLGVIVSAVAGFFAIKVMLKAIGKGNYKWFSLYLLLLSVTCLVCNVCGVL